MVQPRTGSQRSFRTVPAGLAGLALLWGLAGCSSGPVQLRRAPEPRDFTGVHYPSPRAPAPSTPQPPPMPGEPQGPAVLAVPPAPAWAGPADAEATQLANAAVRDRETERLVRGYFALVESLYRIAALQHPTGVEAIEHYDPVPMWRLHGQLVSEMAQLTRRAAELQGRYLDIANSQAIDLLGEVETPGRAGRVRYFFRVCTCIRRDVEERAQQGLAYVRAQKSGTSDAELRSASPPPVRYAADMDLLTRTVECSKLAARTLQIDFGP